MEPIDFKNAPDSKQGGDADQVKNSENKIADANQQQDQSASKQVQEKIENKLGEEYAGIKGKDLPQSPNGPQQEKSLGEQRIRTAFNPSGDNAVDNVKGAFASLIDLCESNKAKDPRLAAIAQTKLEEAAMWTVKLLTA